MTDLTVVEVCAGAGGQSLGLHLAGFRHEVAIEIDDWAARTLTQNLERIATQSRQSTPVVVVGDVADETVWRPEEFKGVSLLAGGVPCPPFSKAGKQLGSSDERDLFAWAVETTARVKPDALMLENVAGLAEARFSGYRQAVLDRLGELGYLADWQMLHARDYGVPQLRPRFVLVALRPDFAPYFRWPDATPTPDTVGSRLQDLMAAAGWPGADQWSERANAIAPTLVGGSKKHGGPDLGPTRAKTRWRALGVDAMGLADAPPGPDMPVGHLPRLTVEMAARLQGWYGSDYDNWQFAGGKTARYRQVGNAFPPPVARAVGQSIAAALRREGQPIERTGESLIEHDTVYKLLRSSGRHMTADQIARTLRVDFTWATQAVVHLSRDFEVETKTVKGQPAYKLGAWRAFRGQEDHLRHLAFASKDARAKIS